MVKIKLTIEGGLLGALKDGKGVSIERSLENAAGARLIAGYIGVYSHPSVGRLNPDEASAKDPAYVEAALRIWFDRVLAAAAGEVAAAERLAAVEAQSAAVKPIAFT